MFAADHRGMDTRGWLVPIGGAEQKDHHPRIFSRFVELCGGRSADLVVIPTASRPPDTGARYERIFTRLGARSVVVLPLHQRAEAAQNDCLRQLEYASGIFFTGGDPLHLTTVLDGTPAARLIRHRHANGIPVGGISLGASALPTHMIALDRSGGPLSNDSVHLAPGLGLTSRLIIDPHFRQRDHLGRLMATIACKPFTLGVGLDEDTAAFISPDRLLEVEGSGAVTIVDTSQLTHSSMHRAEAGDPASLPGLKTHVLTAGERFNLNSLQPLGAGARLTCVDPAASNP